MAVLIEQTSATQVFHSQRPWGWGFGDFCDFSEKISIPTNDATFDVITSNLMFSTHHLMFDVFADESDVRQSGC